VSAPDTALVWLRNDLRLDDNPALQAARKRHRRLLPVFILEPEDEPEAPGAAARVWLHHSLARLQEALSAAGSRLLLLRGEALPRLRELAGETGASALYWNRRYEPAAVARDRAIKAGLDLECHSFNARLLVEPWSVATGAGRPYRVFTPFWKSVRLQLDSIQPVPTLRRLPPAPAAPGGLSLDALGLVPQHPWATRMMTHWRPGEAGAQATLRRFLDQALADYPPNRDLPAVAGTSRLSPHLHFGEIGPRRILEAVRRHLSKHPGDGEAAEAFLRQLGWREFAYHLLFHFPHTLHAPMDRRFEAFPWRRDPQQLSAWQQGRTGIPLVDAGMRELWATGWMHNRVRMLVASLLTKNLAQPWQAGADWFRDTLVDADAANNSLGWQWTAGCGADAAPFFRIFNPVTQGRRFDPEGDYVRRWVPELARVPARWIHEPWAAPAEVLAESGVRLGHDYPEPIVDLRSSREAALAAWAGIRNG